MIREGTLPLRKPGTWIWEPMVAYAASRLGLSSSNGTSTVSLTRVGFRVSTALFTAGYSKVVGRGRGVLVDIAVGSAKARCAGCDRRRPGQNLMVAVARPRSEPAAHQPQEYAARGCRHTRPPSAHDIRHDFVSRVSPARPIAVPCPSQFFPFSPFVRRYPLPDKAFDVDLSTRGRYWPP